MAMGGIGEAALLGAVMGGGSAMLTGGDPLKGAVMGGLTGGAGAGISGALGSAVAPAVAPGVIAPTIAPAVAAETAASTLATSATTPFTASTLNLTPSTALLNSPMPYSAGTNFLEVPGVTNIGNTAFGSSLGQLSTGTGGIANIPTNFAAPVASAATPVASAAPSVIPPPTSQSYGNILGSGSSTLPGISTTPPPSTFMEGMAKFAKDPMASLMDNKFTAAGSALAGANAGKKKKEEEEEYSGPLSRFKYNPDKYRPSSYADGGITSLGYGGYDQMVGEEPMYMSNMAAGGIANLGSYSDGGRMLKGPGDGMSDSIPASISGKRPARLADGEFVVPADVVSHLGNGSTDAGAKQLYAMMDKVRKARTGRKAQGREINPRQYMAA
jgi:hypothetical protein